MSGDRDFLQSLHAQLCESLAARVKESKNDPEKPLTAAEIAAISKFLKDNNITATIPNTAAGQDIINEFPFPITDENGKRLN